MVGEDVAASEYKVVKVDVDTPFAPETMIDEYAPKRRGSRARVGAKVISSISLGLHRWEGISPRGPKEYASGSKGKVLVKPQVVLETIVHDLDLCRDGECMRVKPKI